MCGCTLSFPPYRTCKLINMSFDPHNFEDILKPKGNKDKWELYYRLFQLFLWNTHLHSLAYHPGHPNLSLPKWVVLIPHSPILGPCSSIFYFSPGSRHYWWMSCPYTPNISIPVYASGSLLPASWILCLRTFFGCRSMPPEIALNLWEWELVDKYRNSSLPMGSNLEMCSTHSSPSGLSSSYHGYKLLINVPQV